ncbi:MAG: response regulator [Deltaproteobacteria bacterium]|nr:response regulator [Deltaproteobacteria bacterium]
MIEVKRGNVLVVDDESSNIIALSKTLSPEYTVRAAINGRDAIKTAEKYLPDLILLDVVMPEMDGYAVIAELKNSDKTKDIPVIFLTAMTSPENEAKGMKLGAADYIYKPFSPELLLKRVETHLSLKRHGGGLKETASEKTRDAASETVPAPDEFRADAAYGCADEVKKNSVLIVDDESTNILALTHILGPEYTVRAAINGRDAIKTAEQHLPDIILLDIVMPEMDGYKVLSALKSSAKTKDIPVIFITKLSVGDDEEKGLALGAADYITKPFSSAIVKIRVRNQIQIINQMRMITAANRAKSDFIANMSHEIRTPMNAILGVTEIMMQDETIPRNISDCINKIYSAGDLLLSIINDILDLSKMEAGKLELVRANYETASLISDTVTLNIMRMESKEIEFKLFVDENLPRILFGDEIRIKQILNNLLSNAFKYTEKGEVKLSLAVLADNEANENDLNIIISVSDTGSGMTAEEVKRMFDQYSRFNYKANRAAEGTGLGMSITRNIVKMMNGEILVESEPGKGSIFTVHLPQGYAGPDILGEDLAKKLQDFRLNGAREIKKSNIIYEPMPYGHVLIADDVETNLFVAKGLLLPYELSVDTVASGFDAIDRIRNGKVYDIVFMDHKMPKMDGIEATAIIRDLGYTNPIVALTANTVKGQQEMFLENGFDGFISKPIDTRQLNAVLKKFIRDKQPRDVLEGLKGGPAEALSPDQAANLDERRGKERRTPDIPGLDIDKGIARFGFNEDVFIGLLRSYAKSTRPLLSAIEEVNKDDLSGYAIIVHGIKGSSRGIFAEIAGSEAEALENAAIAGNYDFVSANNQKFLDTVFQLLTDIEEALAKSGREQKAIKDKPDELLLAKLLKACAKHDIDEIDAAMAEMECYEYTSDDGLVAWLREKLAQGKYRAITEAFDLT